MAAKFEVFKDKKSEYRFRLIATNGLVIAVGQGYKSKANCLKGIDSVKRNARDAEIIEVEE